jgi:membrane protease YdiL (CAAX protease family)
LLAFLGPRAPSVLTPVDPSASPLHALLGHPFFKAVLPIPVMFLLAPVVFWFFRRTWYELDRDAHAERGALLAEGKVDLRPGVAFVIAAVILTLQEYYGGRGTFEEVIRPFLQKRMDAGWTWLKLDKYALLYSYGWWATSRILGYVVIPFPLWKLLFPKDSLLDLGLRIRGFSKHLWIYGVCLAVVVPAMFVVARQPDFGSYYPFYKDSSRSWFDFGVWEAMYFAQFFALEMFFRGWFLGTMRRSLGSGAIFAMAVPYCMIHFGKPYLEANGAIIAGIVLGSLSMRTKSIYAGFLVHITVALSMDLLALSHRGALPKVLFPGLLVT